MLNSSWRRWQIQLLRLFNRCINNPSLNENVNQFQKVIFLKWFLKKYFQKIQVPVPKHYGFCAQASNFKGDKFTSVLFMFTSRRSNFYCDLATLAVWHLSAVLKFINITLNTIFRYLCKPWMVTDLDIFVADPL